MKVLNAVAMAHALLVDRLPAARCVVDATAGNGHDTLFLAQHTLPGTIVWAFDIQEAALANTARRLAALGLTDKVRLIGASHTSLADYVSAPIDVVMFNLGYLPGASHAVATTATATTEALRLALGLLSEDGLVSIVTYPGYSRGAEEQDAVAGMLSALPQTEFTVACWQILNQVNFPPVLYLVEKRGRQT